MTDSMTTQDTGPRPEETIVNEQSPEPQQPTTPPAAAPPAGAQQGREGWANVGKQAFDPRRKSPRLAAFLSFVPGVGQVYTGYYVRGFVMAASFLFLLLFAANAPRYMEPIPGFAVFFLWLFNVIDSGRMAALYNHALAGTSEIQVPEDFRMPSMGGSVGGGALLVLFGLLALSNTLFGLSLEWLEYWWPIFPIGLGGYLVVRGVLDRSS